jgi:DNA modification methylase
MSGLLHIQGFCRLVILNAGKLITLEKILDPFIGSGTTAIGASTLGRSWIGIELSEEYMRITRRRLMEYGIRS